MGQPPLTDCDPGEPHEWSQRRHTLSAVTWVEVSRYFEDGRITAGVDRSTARREFLAWLREHDLAVRTDEAQRIRSSTAQGGQGAPPA